MNRRYPALAAIIITFALFAVLVGNFMKSPHAAFAMQADRAIYLTFDDGPSDRVTPKILDILKEENVPATFFIVGIRAKDRKEILKRAVAEGHTLAIHSYTHDYNEIYASADALLKDIEKCNKVICSVTGEYSSIYRFPGGSYTVNPTLIKAVNAMGFRYVDWNASFRDSELANATSTDLYNAAINTVANQQSIVMLAHDATDKIETVGALKEVIKHFKELGYTFKKF